MRRVGRKLVSVLLALAMVVLALPEYVKPVNKAVAAEATPTRKVYVLTDVMTNGGNYLIVNSMTAGETAHAMTRVENGTEQSLGQKEVTIHDSAEEEQVDAAFIEASDVADVLAVWNTATNEDQSQMRLLNDGYYLQIFGTSGSNSLKLTTEPLDENGYSDFNWRYGRRLGGNNFLPQLYVTYNNQNHFGGGTSTRYLVYSNNTFTGSTTGSNLYIFRETEICAHDYNATMSWNQEWFMGEYLVNATAEYRCKYCNKTVHVDATVSREDKDGSCCEAPTWIYTAMVSAAASPAKVDFSDELTITQKVEDKTKPQITTTVYVLSSDAPSVGQEFLIVNTNEAVDDAHVLANADPVTDVNNDITVKDIKATILQGKLDESETAIEEKYIKVINKEAVWKLVAQGNNRNIASDEAYLYHFGGTHVYVSSSGQANYRRWTLENNTVYYHSNSAGADYYLNYNPENANPWRTLDSSASNVYFFVEREVSMYDFSDAKASGHPNLVKTDAKPAGCETDGNIDYWYCETCGNYYNNADGAAEHKISLAGTVIPAAHDWKFDHFEWAGNKTDGWTGAQAVYKCTKTEGQTHTNDDQPVTFTTTEYRTAEGASENKNVYEVKISEADALDGIQREADETIYLYYVDFFDDEGNPIPNAGKFYSKDTEPANIVTPAITKAEDPGHTYAFVGWTPIIDKVTADVNYTAVFSTETKAFTITFVNADTSTLQAKEVEYDTMPVYEGATPTITPTVDKVFTFTGWDPEIVKVAGVATYTAQYSEAPRKYTITFVVDGQTSGGAVEYGATPSYDGTPSKTGVDKNYRYVFIGWQDKSGQFYKPDDDLPSVEEDQTYTAVFETQYYVDFASMTGGKVLFADDSDGYFTENEEVRLVVSPKEDFGSNIFYEYVPDSLTVSKSQGTVAVSAGGDGVLIFSMPAEKVTVDAKFIRVYDIWIGEVQVTEENMDDVLGDGSVSCAYEAPEAGTEAGTEDDTDVNPQEAPQGKWTMTFTKAPELTMSEVTFALITFFEVDPLTIVTPKDGLTLESDDAVVGIFCPETDLTIEGDLSIALNGKITVDSDFGGAIGIGAWDATINGSLSIVVDPSEVEGDADSAYSLGLASRGVITFGSEVGTVDITVPEGSRAIVATEKIIIPETHGIKLPEDGKIQIVVEAYENTIGDVAVEESRYVTIVDADDSAANIVSIRKLAHVKFENDGEVLFEDDFFVGDVPEVELEKEPEKEKDKQYTYEYAGWKDENGEYPKNGDLPELTGDTTFTAYFRGIPNKYKVTFVDEDGTVLKAATEYEYGTKAADIAKPADPTKAATAEKTYGFGGWSPELADVTGDVTYTATYVDANAKYKVTFVDEDGTELKAATEYTYGTKAADIAKPADPTKAEDEKYTYEFSGWSPEISDVINNATYKATYKAVEKKQEEEKGVYQYVGPAELTYTKGSGKGFVFTFKRTKNDELTKERFRKFLRNNADIDAKWLKITYGSVIIEVSSEYLDSLPEGRNEFTATFEDGDPVSVALTILPAQSSEEQTSPDSPKTADTMFVLWLALILGIATVTVAVMIKKREKDEEIGL
jgi:hypothetical protein